jgi:hypothetical protein
MEVCSQSIGASSQPCRLVSGRAPSGTREPTRGGLSGGKDSCLVGPLFYLIHIRYEENDHGDTTLFPCSLAS